MFGNQSAAQKSSPPAWVTPAYTGLQLLTSCESLPVPLVYGMAKLAPNIIYEGNFQSHAQLAWTGSTWIVTGYYYTTDLVFALCEGPISNVNQVWQNSNTSLFSNTSPNPNGWALSTWGVSSGKGASGATLFKGAPGQTAWSYLVSNAPAAALNYQGLAYVGCANFGVGANASVGTLNFEVCGILYGTGANGIDADPARVIQDFLTDSSHGVPGFPSSALDTTTLLGTSGDSSVQSYCAALGLCFSPALLQQESASSVLTRWCQLLNLGTVWTGGKLRFIPYGDMSILGATVNWTAPTTPQYALTTDHFGAKDGEVSGADGSPVVVDRADPLSLYNMQRLEVLNRDGVDVNTALVATRVAAAQTQMISLLSHGVEPGQGINIPVQGQPQYQASPVEARDLNEAQGTGIRIAATISAHEICDLNIGSLIAQTLLQRGLYIRNRYSFTVSFVFCLLDPMDIVSLTEPLTGLSGKLVRITGIEEQDDSSLKITAEDLTIGVSTPGPNPTSGAGSSTVNQNVAAEPINAALVYQPPTAATSGVSALWIGASGGLGANPDLNFGGANIWVSIDGGATYTLFGQTNNLTPIGTLTASLASASGWDTTNTLAVDLTESGNILVSTTALNAQNGVTNVVLVDSELIGFQTATLTGANKYNLTNLQRGLFGTTPAAHVANAQFTCAIGNGSSVAQVPIHTGWSGIDLLIKLQPFNPWGNGAQALSSCVPIPFAPGATGVIGISTVYQTLTLSSGASQTTTAQIPINAYMLDVNVNVTSAIGAPVTSVNIDPQFLAGGGGGGSSGAFGNVGAALGASHTYTTAATQWTVASGVKLTAVGGSFTGGAAQVAITYLKL